jgi:hypothetical protein
MPDVQPSFRLAEEMEESLGAGKVLLGSVQKEASHRTMIQECQFVMFGPTPFHETG